MYIIVTAQTYMKRFSVQISFGTPLILIVVSLTNNGTPSDIFQIKIRYKLIACVRHNAFMTLSHVYGAA